MNTVEEFRVTFNPRYTPEGMDKDGYAVIEAVSTSDAVKAADVAYPGGWNMVYRAALWASTHLEHLFPAGEVARLTTGRAAILQAAEVGPAFTLEEVTGRPPEIAGQEELVLEPPVSEYVQFTEDVLAVKLMPWQKSALGQLRENYSPHTP